MITNRELLDSLPSPPKGKTGWPWTLESHGGDVSASVSDDPPTISIVTPSFNHGSYIEETIRSVILQGYPRLQYIVMDGGSHDGTVEVLEKYDPWIDAWVSEPDGGQSDAINKGLGRCTGDVVNWLCSDDLLTPGALHAIAEVFVADRPDVVVGMSEHFFPDGRTVRFGLPTDTDLANIAAFCRLDQPSCFYRRELLREQPVRVDLHYTMDQELWCTFTRMRVNWAKLNRVLSYYRVTEENKTTVGGERAWQEALKIHSEYCPRAKLARRIAQRRFAWLLKLYERRGAAAAAGFFAENRWNALVARLGGENFKRLDRTVRFRAIQEVRARS